METVKKIIGIVIPWLILTAIVSVISLIFMSATSYVSLTPWCHVSIKGDMLRGDKATIKAAIRELSQRDKEAYKNLCNNIDRIYERYCYGSDWHLDSSRRGENEEGCFIKGSHSMYLRPTPDTSFVTIKKRAETVKKYAEMSREYWEGR